MAAEGTITIDGVELTVPSEDDWTLGEVAEFARLEHEYGSREMALLIGSVWLAKRRADPAFTVEDAKRVKLGQIQQDAGGEEADPTQGSSEEPELEPSAPTVSAGSEAEPSGRQSFFASTT